MKERDYVLGTHDEEIERLGLQHRVWRPHVVQAWSTARFSPGETILDVGCGPGYASIDLAELVGPTGKVIAVDRSRRFLDALSGARRTSQMGAITTHELDLELDPLPGEGLDGAWCRWVYAFLRDPRKLLQKVLGTLRPGGRLVIHEYIRYRSVSMVPYLPEVNEFFDAVVASWRAGGGDPDVAMDLPRWLEEEGCVITSLRPIVQVASPGEPMWTWVRSFIDVYLTRLMETGYITPGRANEIRTAAAAHDHLPGVRLITPTVLEIVARRP